MQNQNDVRMFMELCGQRTESFCTLKHRAQMNLYMRLIAEEFTELQEGVENADIVEIADACGDLIWVILGLMNTTGIPLAPVWEAILASNMSKATGGKILKREDGKILKPDSYFPPDIKKALSL